MKADLTKSMRAFVGGGDFISKPELAKWYRVSKDKAYQIVDGLPAFGDRNKRYFIPEVAERIIERRT